MEYKYTPGTLPIYWTKIEAHAVKKLVERELEHCTVRAEHYALELKNVRTKCMDDKLMHEFFSDRVEMLTGILDSLTTSLK